MLVLSTSTNQVAPNCSSSIRNLGAALEHTAAATARDHQKLPDGALIYHVESLLLTPSTHPMDGTVRDMRRSFRDSRHLSKNFQVIQTEVSDNSTANTPVPSLCCPTPAQRRRLESASRNVDWIVFNEIGRLGMDGEAGESTSEVAYHTRKEQQQGGRSRAGRDSRDLVGE